MTRSQNSLTAMKRSTYGTCWRMSVTRPGSIGLGQTLEKQLLALQRAADRTLERFGNRPRQADQQRVRQVDDVGQRLARQPVEQLVELLAQDAVVALRASRW